MITHEKFMKLALRLALKGRGTTSPNPMVGAVVVRDGTIVGRGYHRRAGEPHAEIIALRKAHHRAQGAILYVTLEPCTHIGRTPPCTDQIIRSGIREIVIGTKDPNPINNGRGIKILRSKGIKVKIGILEEESKKLNEVFAKFITTKLPFVTVKIAQSLDGKIATRRGISKWITNDSARRHVHSLRSHVDAIMVGVETIIKDDPLLTARLSQTRYKKQPIKIVVDSTLRTPLHSKIFSTASLSKVIIATTKYAPKSRVEAFRHKNAQVLVMRDKDGRVSLKPLMRRLAEMEIANVLIEGGGEIIASALKEKLVDKVLFFIAPKIIGGREAITSVEGDGVEAVNRAIGLKEVKIRKFGSDILVKGYISEAQTYGAERT